jgi:FtsP/CotA-like multicopper oxidase with cupredoxin domain
VPPGFVVTADAGRSVYHCHILDHEDLGMMGTINVRP